MKTPVKSRLSDTSNNYSVAYGVMTLPMQNKPATVYAWPTIADAENHAKQLVASETFRSAVIMEMRAVLVFRLGDIVREEIKAVTTLANTKVFLTKPNEKSTKPIRKSVKPNKRSS